MSYYNGYGYNENEQGEPAVTSAVIPTIQMYSAICTMPGLEVTSQQPVSLRSQTDSATYELHHAIGPQ